MYWPNLKSVAFPVPEILGGTQIATRPTDLRSSTIIFGGDVAEEICDKGLCSFHYIVKHMHEYYVQ